MNLASVRRMDHFFLSMINQQRIRWEKWYLHRTNLIMNTQISVISQEKTCTKRPKVYLQTKEKVFHVGQRKQSFMICLGKVLCLGFELFMLCLFCTKYRSLLQAMHKSLKGRLTRRVFLCKKLIFFLELQRQFIKKMGFQNIIICLLQLKFKTALNLTLSLRGSPFRPYTF